MKHVPNYVLLLLLTSCSNKNITKKTEPTWSALRCTMEHSSLTGDELLEELNYYEGLSSIHHAEVIVAFYHEVSDDTTDWYDAEVVTHTDSFEILSSEVVEDGWTDFNGEPLNTVIFEIDFTTAMIVEKDISLFFNQQGEMNLEEGEDVWFHISTATETGTNWESYNFMMTAAGWEEDYGSCTLLP